MPVPISDLHYQGSSSIQKHNLTAPFKPASLFADQISDRDVEVSLLVTQQQQ